MVTVAVGGSDGAADLHRGHDRGDADVARPDVSERVHERTISPLASVVIGPGVQRGLRPWEYRRLSQKPPAGR
jgi:hypothetical protein